MALDLTSLDDIDYGTPRASSEVPIETAPKAPIGEFEEDADQPRFEFDDPEFTAFKEDVRERGILQPLIVRRTEAGKLKIRFGARRYRAGVEVGLTELPYLITEDPRQFDDYAQVAENERRQGLQPLELATFIDKKIKAGEKRNAVAQKLKIDASAVTHLLALVDAPPFVLELYHSRRCRAPHYLYELRKLHKKNAEVVERRIAQADVITGPLIDAIDAEINPKIAPPSGPTDIRDVLDAGGSSGGAGASGGSQKGKEPDGNAGPSDENTDDGPAVQQVPSHNPDIEKHDAPSDDKTKLKKPLLLGKYQNRDVMVLLSHRPSAAGMIMVRYEDGTGDEEVTIGDVTLTLLSEKA
jgi:ParB family chromosome partitioning protein